MVRLRLFFEHYVYSRRLAKAELDHPGPVSKDANNIFSLGEITEVDEIDAVSFDFFDTLVFRDRLALGQVFEKTSQLGAGLVPGSHYQALRKIRATRGFSSFRTKRAMMASGEGDEPRLRRVFEKSLETSLCDTSRLSELAKSLERIETAIEFRNLVAHPDALRVLQDLKRQGRKVIVTSDMYLPSSLLEKVMARCGLAEFVDDVIVSSEHGVTKASGALFATVIARAGMPAEKILHVGDNWQSDVVQARAAGLKALHFHDHEAETTRRRREIRHSLPVPDSVRRARLRREFGLADERSLATPEALVDQVFGPACALFVHGALQRAAREDSDAVYFLTRDGTLFKEVAAAMRSAVPELYPGTAQFNLMATSRLTGMWLSADVSNSDQLYSTTEYLSEQPFGFDRFCRVFGLDDDDVSNLPLDARKWIATGANSMDLGTFRELLQGTPELASLIAQRVEERRRPLLRHLDSVGFFEARRPILVDIGYSGTWGKQLSPLLEARESAGLPVPEIALEFFATNRFFGDNVNELHPAIFMTPGRILDHRRIDCLTIALNMCWLEPFFLDPTRGPLEGYTADGSPVFAPPGFSEADRDRLMALRARMVSRAARLADDLMCYEGDPRELVREVRERMVRLIGTPRRSEVAAMAKLRHERGMAEVAPQSLVRRIMPIRLRRQLVDLIENDYWVQGSLTASGLGFLNHFLAWRYARDRSEFIDWKP